MNTYQKVESVYLKNKESFEILENEFSISFNIPTHIIRNSIKRMLVEAVVEDGKKTFLLNYKNILKDRVIYLFVITYFFILAINPFFQRKSVPSTYDVVFDCWNKQSFDSYYHLLYTKLISKKIAIFSRIKKYKIKGLLVFDKSNNKLFEQNISKLIFKTQYNKLKFYKELSKTTSINFINLSLRLMRYIALYTTDSYNIKTNFFISAGDNYYNSIRSYIYKRNGIKNIILIQNGMRLGDQTSTSGDLYIHSDYYLAFGEYFIENLRGNVKYKIPCGSFKLYQETVGKKSSNEIDIMFVEQVAFIENNTDFKLSSYLKILDMLIKFAHKYKNYKIIYRTRPFKLEQYKNDLNKLKIINNIHYKLKKANIEVDDYSKDSYTVMLKSKLILYYNSAMGIEALGLDKKVLCCNIDKFNFGLSTNDEIGCLVDDSYDLFEKKILFLLKNDSQKINKYYLDKKNKFMKMDESPINKVTDIIEKGYKL